ncbi:MAG: tyrosine recombinase [Planctomycetota bacterium]|jgi:integrase/recombinase XerD
MARGGKRGKASLPDPDVGDFLDYLRLECGLAENTAAAYRRDLAHLSAFLKGRRLAGARRDDLLRFVAAQGRKSTPATVSRRIAAVRMFYKFLRMENPKLADPSSALERPSAWQRLPKILSPSEVEALLAAPAAAFAERKRKSRHARALFLRDRAVLETLYATGCRAAEVADMELSGVNLDVGYVRCRGKGSKERIVPLGGKAQAAIGEYLERGRPRLLGERGESPRLFLSRSGGRLDRIGVWRLVKHYLAVAGVGKSASTHTLRHSFATHMLQGGANLRAIQEMLGHASPITTQIYTHLDRRDLVNAHKKFHPRG